MAVFSSLIGFLQRSVRHLSRRHVNRRTPRYAEQERATFEETHLPEVAFMRAGVKEPLDFSAKKGRKVFAKYLLGQGSETEIREVKRKMKEEIATGIRKEKEMKETSKEQENKLSNLQETPPAAEILLSVAEPLVVSEKKTESLQKAKKKESRSEYKENREAEESRETGSVEKTDRKKEVSKPHKEPLVVREASQQPTPAVTGIKLLPGSSCLKPKEPLVVNKAFQNLSPPAVEIRPLLSVEEPVRVHRASRTSTLRAGEIRPEIRPLPSVEEPVRVHRASETSTLRAGEIRPLPSVEQPVRVHRASRTSTLRAGEIRPEIRPLPSVEEPVRVHRASRHSRPPAAELRPLPSVPKLIIVNRASESSALRGGEIEHEIRPLPSMGEPVKVHRASRHLRPPAAETRPLPSVEETLVSERVFQLLIPPAGGIKTLPSVGEPLVAPRNTTSAPDEVISLTRSLSLQSVESLVQVDPPSQIHSCAEVKSQPASSLLGSIPQLVLMDIECEGSEYVECTGRKMSPGEMKAKQHQPLEAGVKPKRVFAWLGNDSEVQESAPQPQEMEVQAPTDEDSGEEEFEDSKKNVSQKARDDRIIKLFYVNTPCGLKTETQRHLKGQEKPKYKGQGPLVILNWAEKTVREKEEKKKRKKKEEIERQLLLHRYQNDPKLKHLKINKHNPFYNSSSNSV